MARFSSAKSRAFSESVVWRWAAIVRATRFQPSGALKFQKTATAVWNGVRVEPVRLPSVLTSLKSAAYWALERAGGPAGRNCEGAAITHGVIVANWGAAPGRKAGGVGRHWPA